jgi:hypothetical protein
MNELLSVAGLNFVIHPAALTFHLIFSEQNAPD